MGSPASASVTILDNDNLPPSVTITPNPLPGTVLTTPVNLAIGASASDSDGVVTKVEFYSQVTNKIGESLSAPFAITWTNAVAGTQSLTAIAYDNFGATTVSAPVSIILNAPPTVSFTSPPNGATFIAPANVTLVVSATDSDGITQVQFLSGANVLGVRTTPPYSLTVSNLPAGSYSFSASATDSRGATAFASPVNVNVVGARSEFCGQLHQPRGSWPATATPSPGTPPLIRVRMVNRNTTAKTARLRLGKLACSRLGTGQHGYVWQRV